MNCPECGELITDSMIRHRAIAHQQMVGVHYSHYFPLPKGPSWREGTEDESGLGIHFLGDHAARISDMLVELDNAEGQSSKREIKTALHAILREVGDLGDALLSEARSFE